MSLRVAIAGTGFIGAVHAHAVRAAGGRVAAVLASTPERSEAAARRLGAERAAPGVEELVTAEDVDVVHVCTPNHLHDDIAEAAVVLGPPAVRGSDRLRHAAHGTAHSVESCQQSPASAAGRAR